MPAIPVSELVADAVGRAREGERRNEWFALARTLINRRESDAVVRAAMEAYVAAIPRGRSPYTLAEAERTLSEINPPRHECWPGRRRAAERTGRVPEVPCP